MSRPATRSAALSRITVDIPKVSHKRLKAMAALEGKSMREIINNLIDRQFLENSQECPLDHTPNKRTLKAIQNIENGKNIVKVKNVKELLKKLGI